MPSEQPSLLKTSLPSTHAASSSQIPPPPPYSSSTSRPQLSESQKRQYLSKPGTEPRHLAIALHHAHRIQSQKDTESLILDRILQLVTFPSPSTVDPATPAPDDVHAFKSALVPFQPADYDNLIQERNIEGLCGYVLCPREHRTEDRDRDRGQGSKPSYRIVWGKKGTGEGGRGREMNIVSTEKLEMWCSDECKERAMYVRVQLGEEPVWERRAEDTSAKNIVLLEEGRAKKQASDMDKDMDKGNGKGKGKERESDSSTELAGQLENLDLDRSNALALERGDSAPASKGGRVDVQIREKERVLPASVRSPQLRQDDREGGSVEGYVPQKHRARDSTDEEDILDQF